MNGEHTNSGTIATVRPYKYSVGFDTTAKGIVEPSVRINSDESMISNNNTMISIEDVAVDILNGCVARLRKEGYKVATDIDAEKKEALI